MAATDLERLVVQLSADIKKYENAMRRAQGVTNRRLGAIRKKVGSTGAAFTVLGSKVAAAFAVAGGARGLKNLLDASTRIDNALKVAGLSGEELESVYARLRDSAVKSAAPLEALVELYGRAALVQKELGVSSGELLKFTDSIAVALRVSGKSAAESSGALLQLSQALGSGVVRAEEFNSILEGALPIAQAAAGGLKEAGGSVAKLRQLVVDGKISSEAFFRAFEAGAPILEEKVKNAALTTDQAMGNIQTALIDAAREFAKGSLAAEDLASAFQKVADFINGIDFNAFGEEARRLVGYIGEIKSALDFVSNLGADFGRATGLDNVGEFLTGGAISRGSGPFRVSSDKALQRRIDSALAGTIDTSGGLTEDAIKLSAGQVVNQSGKTGRIERIKEIDPVSIKDFKAPSGKKKGGGSKKQSDFAREVEQIKERTAALQAETLAQSGLNPLIDDYGFALELAKSKQDLLAAAEKAGLAITPALKSSIDELATGYANASVAAAQLAESQDDARERAEEFRDLGKSVFSGFISDLRQGKSASEALAGALQKVGDKLLDIAINSIFDGKRGGGFGGILGGIGKLFGFDKGGYTGNGGRMEPAGVVHKGEYVMDAKATKRIGVNNLRRMQQGARRLPGFASGGLVGSAPRLPSMARPASAQQGGHITVSGEFAVQNGNLVPVITAVSGQVAGKQIKKANRGLPGRIQTIQTRGA